MAEESLALPAEPHSVEWHLVTLFEKIESLRRDAAADAARPLPPMGAEIKTLEFWRSVISECMASFFYVFIVCGAAAGAGVGASISSVMLASALAAGFAMAALTQCFGHVSGAHVNPAVSVAMFVTRNITPLRALMFITAQCGGSIAGSALLYGVSVPGYKSNLAVSIAHTASIAAWERFGVEFMLTFIIVFTYFVSMDSFRKWLGTSALAIGSAYSACTFVSMPYLNPARSLGPSFVLNKWENHWVYWLGPLMGGALSGLIYEFIFSPRRQLRKASLSMDGDSSSLQLDEDTYDDLEKGPAVKYHESMFGTYRSGMTPGGPSAGVSGYCQDTTAASLYSAPASRLERVESLYGGTKSLYCKSPPMARASLNRSQSVYTKANCPSGVRDPLGRPGPLVPAQSLYPLRLQSQNQTHLQNQNVHNQIQLRADSVYRPAGPSAASNNTAGTTGTTGTSNTNGPNGIYGTRANPNSADGCKYTNPDKGRAGARPDSMYGLSRRGGGNGGGGGQSVQSDDSSYGSYHGPNQSKGGGPYVANHGYGKQQQTQQQATPGYATRQSPPTQLLTTANGPSASYHPHSRGQQHSPNPQY